MNDTITLWLVWGALLLGTGCAIWLAVELQMTRRKLRTQELRTEHFRKAAIRSAREIEQVLGAALGYPWYCDDPLNFPGSTKADGVCVGDATAESLADEAADKIRELQNTVREMRGD